MAGVCRQPHEDFAADRMPVDGATAKAGRSLRRSRFKEHELCVLTPEP